MAEFDADRYRIATDAMVDAGFDDVAEWTRAKIAEQERRIVSFAGIRLGDLAEQLRAVRLIYPSGVSYEQHRSLHIAAQLVDWVRGQADPEALAAIPASSEGTGPWRHIDLPIGPRVNQSVVLLCPICSPPPPVLAEDRPFTPHGPTFRTVIMNDIRIGDGSSSDAPTLYIGRCEGCRNWFAG